jgi:hypothetical protein
MKKNHKLFRSTQLLLSAIILSMMLPSLSPLGLVSTSALAAPVSAPVTDLKFDFGSATSAVAAGYQQVANTMLYIAERGARPDGQV